MLYFKIFNLYSPLGYLFYVIIFSAYIKILQLVALLVTCDYPNVVPQSMFTEPFLDKILEVFIRQPCAICNTLHGCTVRRDLNLVSEVVNFAINSNIVFQKLYQLLCTYDIIFNWRSTVDFEHLCNRLRFLLHHFRKALAIWKK